MKERPTVITQIVYKSIPIRQFTWAVGYECAGHSLKRDLYDNTITGTQTIKQSDHCRSIYCSWTLVRGFATHKLLVFVKYLNDIKFDDFYIYY